MTSLKTVVGYTFAVVAVGVSTIDIDAFGADDKPKPKAAQSSLDDELFKELGGDLTPGGDHSAGKSKPESKQPEAVKPDVSRPSSQPAAKGEGTTGTKPTGVKPAPKLSPLDAELLRKLEGEAAPEREPQPQPSGSGGGSSEDQQLERLSNLIRQAEARIRQSDSGSETQRMQGEIVEELQRLIARIEQQQQQQQQSKSSKPGGQPKPQPNQPQQQPGRKQGSDGNNENARDSRDGTRSPDNRKPDPAKLKEMLAKVWGTLPERERQDIMQTSFDDLPAKYQFVIEEYFKRLIERRE